MGAAGCDAVSPAGALIIGFIASFFIVFGIEFIDKVLKIDDPVGAIGVHGICGALGTILTGLFSLEQGLFYSHGPVFLGIQVLGVVVVIAWVSVTMIIVFHVIKATIGLRVTPEEEILGLDIEEHGLPSSYADFMPAATASTNVTKSPATVDAAIAVENYTAPIADSTQKMTKLSAVLKQNKFDDLKAAMNNIGVTGMTVTNVLGCGMQKGAGEYYRGVPVEITLLPKVKVEIVVCKIPVATVISSIKKALYTGHIGDGKIFVYHVEDVIKVRTGETGYDALQDD